MKTTLRNFILQHNIIRNNLFLNLAHIAYTFIKTIGYIRSSRCSMVIPNQLRKYKTSNTLFILGAGTSLNNLSVKKWEEIEAHDVAGTSWTCLLPIKQTYYFLEGPTDIKLLRRNFATLHSEAIRKFKSGHFDIMIWKNPHVKRIAQMFDMSLFVIPFLSELLADGERGLRRLLYFLLKIKFTKLAFIQIRASIFALAWLGVALGYKNIVFCGVDLTDSRYFFEQNPLYEGCNLIKVFSDPSARHKTALPEFGLPIDLALKCLCDECPSVSFYTGDENSRLAVFLPVWRFKQ